MRELRLVCGIQKPRLATTTQLTMALDALDLTARRCPIAKPAWYIITKFLDGSNYLQPAVVCRFVRSISDREKSDPSPTPFWQV